MEHHIASFGDLMAMTPAQLSQEANLLLYGSRDVLEEAEEREFFRVHLYVPRRLSDPLIYAPPKLFQGACSECQRPKSYGSASVCRFCYRLAARARYYEAADGAEWLAKMGRGVAMPETEWWDDSDMPARPKRLARIEWDVSMTGQHRDPSG